MNETLFHQNLELWGQTHPKEAVMLPYIDEKPLTFSENFKETKQWFDLLDLKRIEVLYVYGIGEGGTFKAAHSWLKSNPRHHLIFLEDDVNVLYHLLQKEVGSEILKHPQVQLHFFEDLQDKEAILEVTYWDFLTTQVAATAIPLYAKEKPERSEQLEHKILFDTATKNALVDEYMKYGAGFFKNFYPNMRVLHQSLWGNKFFGKFRGIPAIICGAGPSLMKSIPELKKLTDQALIFAGGSAVNALDDAGIVPHFGAGIDPNEEQYKRFSQDISFEVPFLYRNRMHHGAFMAVQGPRLYISGSGGYDIADWFEERFDIAAEFLDEGHNVVNFCTEIAARMGCNPIIFVGLDLAYTGMELYAPGVIGDSKVTADELLSVEEMDDRAIIRTDIHGEPIYTLWKWIAESEWLRDFVKEHPRNTLLNATEGGIGIPDVPNVTLRETAAEHLTRSHPLKEQITQTMDAAKMPQVTEEAVQQAFTEMETSLHRSIEHLNTLIDESSSIKERESESMQTGLAALAETELAEEPAYTAILDIFNAVYTRVLNRDMNRIKQIKDSKQKRLATIDLNIKKFTFLRDVAQANLTLMEPL